jgi:hypothetical protein
VRSGPSRQPWPSARSVAAAASILGLGLVAFGCGGGSDGGGGSSRGGGLELTVTSMAPEDGETNVPASTGVHVTFDREVAPGTLTSSTFVVSDGAGPVAGAVTYDAATRTATFTPSAPFATSTQYQVSLSALVTAPGGDPALTAFTGGFTTGSTTDDVAAPTFAGLSTVSVESGASLLLAWPAANDDFNDAGAIRYLIYRATSTGAQNFSAPVGSSAAGATTYLDRGLSPSTQYFYVVRAVDSSGNEDTNTAEVDGTTDVERSYAADVFPLFTLPGTQDCTTAGCHGLAPQGGLVMLSPSGTYAELVGVVSQDDGGCSPLERVAPGAPEDSFLYRKLTATHDCGSAMPRDAPALSSGQLDVIEDWIEEGAQNN